jgi:hypothetical protein
MRPPQSVPSQLMKKMAEGQKRQQRESRGQQRCHTGGEHMVAIHNHAEEGDRDHGIDGALVAEGGLAREEAEEVSHDAPGGQNENVNFRVSENPEKMLIENRVAGGAGFREGAGHVKVRSEGTVQQKENQTGREDRKEKRVQDRGQEHAPDGDRHIHEAHTGSAEADSGRDVVNRAHDGRSTGEVDRNDPQRLTLSG